MNANFTVDPRLASLLGENYRSTELAIKELVDNAYDADAENVWVTLPEPLTNDPIIIEDDGTGMTEHEVRNEYLKIASSRISRKGERTRLKNRKVKGRKGIGKFAGLMVASLMEVRTYVRGKYSHLKIWRDELSRAQYDIEQIELPLITEACSPEMKGTQITLSGINQNYTFPQPERLKRLLIIEYGRQPDFQLFVNGEKVDIEDIPGENFEYNLQLNNKDWVQVKYTISDGQKPIKQPGLAIRVGGKVVGNPTFCGLDECDDVPPRLLRRLYGNVMADCLESDVTADWGSIVENSRLLAEIMQKLAPQLKLSLQEVYHREIRVVRARLKKKIDLGLSRLPMYRRKYAERTLDKVLHKFYGESEARMGNVISVLLESFEKSEYWMVMQDLEKARDGKIDEMTEAFSAFGMLDLAMITQQSSHRSSILEDLEKLIFYPSTSMEQIRQALANNLWVLGSSYSLLSSHAELEEVAELFLNHKFSNGHSHLRPHIILAQEFNKRFVVIDLKAPDHTIDLQDRRKAKEYIKDLQVYLPQRSIEVVILGGALSSQLVDHKVNSEIRFLSYKGMISDARVQLNWILESLKKR